MEESGRVRGEPGALGGGGARHQGSELGRREDQPWEESQAGGSGADGGAAQGRDIAPGGRGEQQHRQSERELGAQQGRDGDEGADLHRAPAIARGVDRSEHHQQQSEHRARGLHRQRGPASEPDVRGKGAGGEQRAGGTHAQRARQGVEHRQGGEGADPRQSAADRQQRFGTTGQPSDCRDQQHPERARGAERHFAWVEAVLPALDQIARVLQVDEAVVGVGPGQGQQEDEQEQRRQQV